MSDEDWVKAAMTDDSVVGELLVRLHHAPPPKRDSHLARPLEWTVRQRRSKPVMIFTNKKPTPRASPTTPLSLSSGATSVDGSEESSLPPPSAARSKVTATSGAATNKRARKKKTLAELKEDETLLLKERRHLKRELATLRVTLEKQRATNENLKRLKLDLDSPTVAERVIVVASVEAIPAQTQQKLASSDPMPPILPPEVRIDDHNAKQQPSTPKDSSQLHPEVISPENKFVLPDLNQPIEDDSNSEVLPKVS
ncbi:DNA topoisomerase 4 subunit A like [Actinidia chinensis var. chinensis]|uniref:DNA topoisomerase 4 subunit A like n=1 Tax=Actinidia chinensis var. chinensis TaxID=1590841 RepID=A0A2R6PSP3_ACTCC|nr:DNA topoisomerase 4 subunit A like [Actinidia chinensis var. chinensis]